MEGDPVDGIVEHNAGGNEELGEPSGVDAVLAVLLEVEARFLQELDRVGDEDVPVDVELAEVELPHDGAAGGRGGREIPCIVGESEAKLQEVKQVNVGAEGVVVCIGRLLEVSKVADDDAGEFGVHGYEGEFINDVADHGELRIEVLGPHLPDLDTIVLALRHLQFQIKLASASANRRIKKP